MANQAQQHREVFQESLGLRVNQDEWATGVRKERKVPWVLLVLREIVAQEDPQALMESTANLAHRVLLAFLGLLVLRERRVTMVI